MNGKWILSGMLLLIGVGIANAASGDIGLKADDIIAARQAGYDLAAATVGAMKGAVDAEQDVKPYADGAKALAHWGAVIPTMFPVGTEQGHNTKAKAEIWSDRPGFEKAAADMNAAAMKLAQVADTGDKAAFADQFKVVTQACGACHKTYRQRDK